MIALLEKATAPAAALAAPFDRGLSRVSDALAHPVHDLK